MNITYQFTSEEYRLTLLALERLKRDSALELWERMRKHREEEERREKIRNDHPEWGGYLSLEDLNAAREARD